MSDSVAPLVKTISFAEAFIARATCSRAASTAASASQPNTWPREAGLPKDFREVRRHRLQHPRVDGRRGVVVEVDRQLHGATILSACASLLLESRRRPVVYLRVSTCEEGEPAMSDSRPPVLSDELLRRFHERAPVYDRENRFFSEDFEDLRKTGYLNMAVPARARGAGPVASPRCMRETAPARLLRAGDRARHQHAHLLVRRRAADPGGGRQVAASGCSRPPARARSSPPATPRPATTCPCCCRRRKAERVDGGYRFTGRKSFGSLTPVWTLSRPPRHGPERPEGAEDRPRVPAARRRRATAIEPTLGRARHARHPQRRHDPRRASSSRTTTSRASCPPGAAASTSSCCRSSPGR